jgi:type I restriction enzyme M protein
MASRTTPPRAPSPEAPPTEGTAAVAGLRATDPGRTAAVLSGARERQNVRPDGYGEPVITGELKSKIDRVWDSFWSGGISNPVEVIEQITYLLFIRRLDELHTLAENKANTIRKPIENPLFLPGQEHLRWSRFKNDDPAVMFKVVSTEVFPYLQQLGQRGGDDTTYSDHMRDARFTIPTPALLSKVVDLLDDIPMANRDTNGDLYEYMLGKLATSGTNGQFRTPRHIIELMVAMTAAKPDDEICDPACGTAGFLVAASEYVREQHPSALTDARQRQHFHSSMFHGYDFDSTMLRIGSMNMLLHGVESADIRYRDSLSEGASGEAERFTLILANPPFAGSLDYEATSKDLQRIVKTKKTELLFLALFLKLLKPGGRAAVIVPDGVLFGSSNAHKALRKALVEEQKLDAVVKLPSGVFRPYAGVSTAILFFTRTDSGGTEDVWFYDVRADGYSLDDKRNPVEANDLPDVLARWSSRPTSVEPGETTWSETTRARTEQSFLVPKTDIVAQGYDLSLNRYKEIEYDEVEHRAPLEIIADIEKLEAEISDGLAELKAMLS